MRRKLRLFASSERCASSENAAVRRLVAAEKAASRSRSISSWSLMRRVSVAISASRRRRRPRPTSQVTTVPSRTPRPRAGAPIWRNCGSSVNAGISAPEPRHRAPRGRAGSALRCFPPSRPPPSSPDRHPA